jgi:hypothetical protein
LIEIKKIKGSETWLLRYEVMYPDTSIDFVKSPNDIEGDHFGLFYNNKFVSVVSLFFNENLVQFRKLATRELVQGKGFVSLLLNYIFDYVKKSNTSKIWCNARHNKIGFYQKFEMIVTNSKFRKEEIDYVVMEKIF